MQSERIGDSFCEYYKNREYYRRYEELALKDPLGPVQVTNIQSRESTILIPPAKAKKELDKLSHPNITLIDTTGQRTLQQLMKTETLSDDKKLAYSRDICRGFVYLHSQGIVRLAISSHNVCIAGDDRVQLCGFGSALLDTRVAIKNTRREKVKQLPFHAVDVFEQRNRIHDLEAQKFAELDRADLGRLFHNLFHNSVQVDSSNTASSVSELVQAIEEIKIMPTTPDNPILQARDICWAPMLTKDSFLSSLCKVLQVALFLEDTLDKPIDAYTPDELYTLAQVYENTLDLHRKNYCLAATCYHKAAELGHKESQYIVGMKHLEGVNGFFAPDSAKGIDWLKRAACQGHLKAQKELGYIFTIHSSKVTYDPHEAIRWFEMAANQGDLASCEQLGKIYYRMVNAWRIYFDEPDGIRTYTNFGKEEAISIDMASLYFSCAESCFEKAAYGGWSTNTHYLECIKRDRNAIPREEYRRRAASNVRASYSNTYN